MVWLFIQLIIKYRVLWISLLVDRFDKTRNMIWRIIYARRPQIEVGDPKRRRWSSRVARYVQIGGRDRSSTGSPVPTATEVDPPRHMRRDFCLTREIRSTWRATTSQKAKGVPVRGPPIVGLDGRMWPRDGRPLRAIWESVGLGTNGIWCGNGVRTSMGKTWRRPLYVILKAAFGPLIMRNCMPSHHYDADSRRDRDDHPPKCIIELFFGLWIRSLSSIAKEN